MVGRLLDTKSHPGYDNTKQAETAAFLNGSGTRKEGKLRAEDDSFQGPE